MDGCGPRGGQVHLSILVTPEHFDRAIGLLNQLARLLENAGFKFVMPEVGETRIKLVVAAIGTDVEFHIKEEVERYERELKPHESAGDIRFIWDRWRYRNTGRLKLIISEYHPEGGRKSWGDGKNSRLEEKLADAVPDFVICAQGKYAEKLEQEARMRRWEEEDRLRGEAEERERVEKNRRDGLFAAAANWKKADELKAFRAACAARLQSTTIDGTLTKRHEEWLAWVDEVVRDTNPLSAGFLGRLEGYMTIQSYLMRKPPWQACGNLVSSGEQQPTDRRKLKKRTTPLLIFSPDLPL